MPPPKPRGAADRARFAKAIRKGMEGELLTRADERALRRFEREWEERLRWAYYEQIPAKHWREMSGRQTKVINEQAERYGLPFGGRLIDLPAVVRRLHDFLADNHRQLGSSAGEDMMSGPESPALERFREERAALARLDRLERERQLLPKAEVVDALGRIAAIIREAGETIDRQHSKKAAAVLAEALVDAEREMADLFTRLAEEAEAEELDMEVEP